ncbi:MAG: DUF3520 domain-containing protein, partial [Deltaproteobacteria bacterium]|nr:DUF3520 domain-containing protein [Deltaproteobacteria bacterium]
SPLESDRYLLRLGIKAKDVSHSPKPWNLVFLIDVSGSMADGNKLPLVKKALRLVVDRMKSSDKIAIVTYSGEARVALESSSADDKAKIISVIDSLSAGGSTNGSGGINAAYSLAERAKIEGGVNRVILATDGDFNVGTTSFDELIKLIENQRRSGVTLTTLGFGYGNLKDGTLEQLANKGNGNYFYIDTFSEARRIFEEQLLGTLEVVAKDVKLQVEFNPTKVASYRLIGYENRNLRREDFNNDAVDAGEVGSGHKVTALYELVLKGSPLEAKLADNYRYQEAERGTKAVAIGERYTNEMGYLKIRYKEPDGSESKLLEFPLEAAKVKESAAEASSDFRFAAAVSYFAHLLRDSQYKGNYSFKEVQKLAESAQGSDRSGHRREFVELVKNAAAIARR